MTPNQERQTAVSAGNVAALTRSGVVAELVQEQLAEEKKRGQERNHKVRPSEKRRKARKMTITFSDSAITDRIRAQAERWGLYALGGSPNGSTVVEYLLLPRLEAAERGEIGPPE